MIIRTCAKAEMESPDSTTLLVSTTHFYYTTWCTILKPDCKLRYPFLSALNLWVLSPCTAAGAVTNKSSAVLFLFLTHTYCICMSHLRRGLFAFGSHLTGIMGKLVSVACTRPPGPRMLCHVGEDPPNGSPLPCDPASHGVLQAALCNQVKEQMEQYDTNQLVLLLEALAQQRYDDAPLCTAAVRQVLLGPQKLHPWQLVSIARSLVKMDCNPGQELCDVLQVSC